jgi:hypothetical protein
LAEAPNFAIHRKKGKPLESMTIGPVGQKCLTSRDKETGKPLPETLKALGLANAINDIWKEIFEKPLFFKGLVVSLFPFLYPRRVTPDTVNSF